MSSEGRCVDAWTPGDIFQCQRCGQCCLGYGGTFATEKDRAAIAAFIGCPPERFAGQFCERSSRGWVLARAADGNCIFCEGGDCAIHPVKPRMCREWPFIPAVLVDINNWYLMATVCPGIRTDIPRTAVLACVRQVLEQSRGRIDAGPQG